MSTQQYLLSQTVWCMLLVCLDWKYLITPSHYAPQYRRSLDIAAAKWDWTEYDEWCLQEVALDFALLPLIYCLCSVYHSLILCHIYSYPCRMSCLCYFCRSFFIRLGVEFDLLNGKCFQKFPCPSWQHSKVNGSIYSVHVALLHHCTCSTSMIPVVFYSVLDQFLSP